MNEKVDLYLEEGCGRCSLHGTPECKVHTWQKELRLLRSLANQTELVEDVKWGNPCYTLKNKNVFMVTAFKGFACISFFKGALLKDEAGALEKPGDNSQAFRLFKFTNPAQIEKQEDLIKAYMHEAIELEKAGKKIETKKKAEPAPEELLTFFDKDPALKAAFEALTPGRQRGYILFFSQPKQAKTRISRIEKNVDKIMQGIGLHDNYKC